jgi:hypothetical protein
MVDRDPQRRRRLDGAAVWRYSDFRRRLECEITIYGVIYAQRRDSTPFLQRLTQFITPGGEVISQQVDELRLRRKMFADGALREAEINELHEVERLQRYVWLAAFLHYATLVAFVFFMGVGADALRREWHGTLGELWRPDTDFRNWVGGVWGRLVGISFSFVALKYYVSIFSQVSARELGSAGGRLARLTDWTMRANSFTFAGPIWYAFVVDPRQWALCSAAGSAFVILNNLLSYRLAVRARARMKRAGESVSKTVDDVLDVAYPPWWKGMLAYGVGLLAVAVLLGRVPFILQQELIYDDWVYAIVTVVLNMWMYAYNCTERAPSIRSMLFRLYDGLRRIEAPARERSG